MLFDQLVCNGVIAGSNYALIALGFTIIYTSVRFFHFAHGSVFTIGAYLYYTLFICLSLNPIVSLFLSATISALVGITIDRFIYRRLRLNNAPNLVFLIASFGIFIFLQNLLQLIYGSQILTLRTWEVSEGISIRSAIITPIQLGIFCVAMLLFLILGQVIHKTRIGKSILAVADDPLGASVSGINPEKVILYAFGIGSALAGMAGVLVSLETNIEPTMGMNAILKGIIASIIGGIGSIPGAVLGGLFLGLAENLGIWKIQAGWKDTIAFVILILFLLFRPQGILGSKEDRI